MTLLTFYLLPFRRSFLTGFWVLALSGLAMSAAFAQTVPPSVSPGQIQKRFEEQAPAPPSAPMLQLPTPSEAPLSKEMQEQLSKKQFVLKEVVIEDSTVYSPADLKFAYENMIGKTISMLDAEGIASQITHLYHTDGYVLSQAIVPPQDVSNGVLKIRVIEGYVGNTIIRGDVSDDERKVIQDYADHITGLRPVRTQDLERYLLLINDLPGATVSGLLRPSSEGTGSADLVLTLSRKRFDGSYTLDDRGSKYIGPWQHTFAVAANSIIDSYDRTQLRMFTSSPNVDELFGVELSHQENLDSEGTMLNLLASHTHTHPQDSLTSLDLNGQSNLFEAQVTHPFIRMRQENLIGRATFDYHDTITDIFRSTPFTYDRLRVARIGGNYNIIDPWYGNNTADLQMSQGLDMLGATDSGTNRSNANGDASFTKFNGTLSRLQPLPEKFSLLTAGTGQYSFQPLLADEQFSLGGPDWARAFDPAELLGDRGLAGKTELRYTDLVGQPYLDSYQLYGFYDIGHVWVLQGAAGANNNTTLSSIGAGTRMTFTQNFSGNLEIAVPLISDAVDQTSYRGSARVFGSLVAKF